MKFTSSIFRISLLILICIGCGCSSGELIAGSCKLPKSAQKAEVERVVDGDTIHLVDKRKIRMLGLNAPELAKRGKKGSLDEPFAQQAKQHLQQMVATSKNRIYLQIGKDATDKYNRVLAHTFDIKGNNLEEQMIKSGLAFRVSYVPNTEFDACLSKAEQHARQNKLGLWKSNKAVINAANLQKSGFQIIKVKIDKVVANRGGLWFDTADNLSLHLSTKVIKEIDDKKLSQIKNLAGKTIEARGWIVDRSKNSKKPAPTKWLLPITSPSMLDMD